MRPKLFLDIKHGKANSFSSKDSRVNLDKERNRISYFRVAKYVVLGAVSFYMAFGFVVAPHQASFVNAQSSDVERAALEKELAELEAQIAEYESIANQYKKEGDSLKSEIGGLDAKINKLNAQIRSINLSLNKLTSEISQNQTNIKTTEQRLDISKEAIGIALQQMHESEQVSLVAILLKNPNLSDFFSDINNLLDVQDSLTKNIQEAIALRDNLLTEKDSLADKKAEAAAFRAFQLSQKNSVDNVKEEKDQLLEITKGKEAEYQKIVQEKKATAAEIRSRIFRLLGGGEMTFEQAYDFAKFAENATGVQSSFLLAILDRESALGQNVGRCSYTTDMAPGPPDSKRDDVTPFLQITGELGLNPEQTLISCANADGAYGGAMGPSQFIPTTWMLYRDKIAKITGNDPPSPWRNGDAFVGTALYLKDALRGCTQYEGNTQIRCAAARYYAGGYYKRHMWTTYGTATLSRKLQFDEDIAILEGN